MGLGVPVTVTSVMMSINYDRLADAGARGGGLRGPPPRQHLSAGEDRPLHADLRAVLARLPSSFGGNAPRRHDRAGAGRCAGSGRLRRARAAGDSTVRVAPDGGVLPCTYWPASRLTLTDLARLGAAIVESAEFLEARRVPAACLDCPCRGGCAGRRALAGGLDAPDPYCPFTRGDRIVLDWERTKREDLPKMGSACTTVVSAAEPLDHGCRAAARPCSPRCRGRSIWRRPTAATRNARRASGPSGVSSRRPTSRWRRSGHRRAVPGARARGASRHRRAAAQPEIFEIVAYLKSRAATVLFNSDAISLTRARALKLIDSGLDEYRVSMDAATPETYRRVRGVDQFERVVANVRRLVELKQERSRLRPVSRSGSPRAGQPPRAAGVRATRRQRGCRGGLCSAAGLQRARPRDRGERAARPAAPTRAGTARSNRGAGAALGIVLHASGLATPLASLNGQAPGARPWAGCQRPWTLSYVTANGNVLPCCISPWVARDYQAMILGHAFAEPFTDIWNGERYRRFRNRLRERKSARPVSRLRTPVEHLTMVADALGLKTVCQAGP